MAHTPDDMEEFLREIEEFKAAQADADEAGDGSEQADELSDDTEHTADTINPTFVSPELLELQRGQLEISKQIAEALARKDTSVQEDAVETDDIYKVDYEELTPDEQQAFNESAPVIGKIARKSVAEALKQYDSSVGKKLREEKKALQDKLAELSMHTAAQHEQLADTKLKGLTAGVIDDYNKFIKSKDWQDYLDSDAMGVGVPMREIALMHQRNSNLEGIAKMMISAAKSSRRSNTQVSPGSASAAPSHRTEGAKALPYSRYKEAIAKRNAGELTDEAFARIEVAYELAGIRNNIDYNA